MGLPVTIGLVTVAVGKKYRGFLPEWLKAVNSLERQPDQITIISDTILPFDQYATNIPMLTITSDTSWNHHPQILINEAIESTHTDWICKMDADDLIYPHALNRVDSVMSDVISFGINMNNEREIYSQQIEAKHVLDLPFNLVFSGSPFRRELWEQNPFRDMIYEDWAFWIEAAGAGATFLSSQSIDYLYRLHDSNISTGTNDEYWTNQVNEIRSTIQKRTENV